MRLSRRIEKLPPYLFTAITRAIAEKRAQGVDVVTFAIGDPDIPTPRHILDSLHAAAEDPANHRYPESDGLPELRRAIAGWYERRFGLGFDPDKEVQPLLGSKEGISNVALCLVDPGDVVLIPSPGSPPPSRLWGGRGAPPSPTTSPSATTAPTARSPTTATSP